MLSRWLLDFWHGYVEVVIKGERVPELLNLATAQGIELWEIRQVKNGAYRLRMHRQDVQRLRHLMRQTHSKIHFVKKLGIPFLVWRALRRKFFLAGALTFVVLLYTLTSFVWKIDVEGNFKHISPETVLEAAAQIGLSPGAWKGNLPDTDILQYRLLDKVPDLSWVGIKIHGTHVYIQAVEKVPGVTPAPSAPQNIVATKKGTIKDIYAYRGKPTVVRGQYVQPGQVLISGSLGDGQTNVHATGTVTAEIWYTSDVLIPLQTERKKFTGNAVEKQFLTFWGHPIQIWGYGQIPYKNVEEQAEDKVLKIGNFVFPIQYRDTTYREVETEPVTLTEEQAVQAALERAQADVTSKMGKDGTFESQKVLQKEIKDGNLEVKVLNKVVEDIGQAQPYAPEPVQPSDPNDPNAKSDTNTPPKTQ